MSIALVEVQVFSSAPRRSYTNPRQAVSAWGWSQPTLCAHPLGWAFFVVRPVRRCGCLGVVGGCRRRLALDWRVVLVGCGVRPGGGWGW